MNANQIKLAVASLTHLCLVAVHDLRGHSLAETIDMAAQIVEDSGCWQAAEMVLVEHSERATREEIALIERAIRTIWNAAHAAV